MSKKKHGTITIVRSVGISLGCLLILTWVAAFMIWKGRVSVNTMKICAPLFSLLAGFAALLSSGKGEGRVREVLFSGIVSAVLLLLTATILTAKEGVSFGMLFNAACLLLPCLIPVLKTNKRSSRRRSVMKRHSARSKRR